ncbi:MAG: ribosome assembly RNA-binding protein YhbY [Magnetococcales bacterium]|nr:ribosome assembly RNA-binding protein YhbY [Magnetococcales bacterium]
MPLTSTQRKFLRGRAHGLEPVILVGREGVSTALLAELDLALEAHELIKVKFHDHKEEKETLTERIALESGGELAGMIGHVAIFYRPRRDPDKRTLRLP